MSALAFRTACCNMLVAKLRVFTLLSSKELNCGDKAHLVARLFLYFLISQHIVPPAHTRDKCSGVTRIKTRVYK